MNRTVSFENNPLTLIGRRLSAGDAAPVCTLTNGDSAEVSLGSFGGKTRLIHFFPSLDTPVCDLQVREFDRMASALGKRRRLAGAEAAPRAESSGDPPKQAPHADARCVPPHPDAEPLVIGVSMDLPFALKRFSETFGIGSTLLLSDHRRSSFGINYGVLIKEWNLLARGVLIIDRDDSIRYFRLVEEISNPPDFGEALGKLEEAMSALGRSGELRAPSKIRAATALGAEHRGSKTAPVPLPGESIGPMLERLPGWKLANGSRISRGYSFKSFADAKRFLDVVSLLADERNHHPSFFLDYNRLEISLTTHSAGGLTSEDFTLAGIINQAS